MVSGLLGHNPIIIRRASILTFILRRFQTDDENTGQECESVEECSKLKMFIVLWRRIKITDWSPSREYVSRPSGREADFITIIA